MIYANLADAGRYGAISPRIKQAFDFLRTTDLQSLPSGRHEIDGDNLYANVFRYDTKPLEQAAYEGHRAYLDLHYVCAGEEDVYCGFLPDFTMCGTFDTATDSALFDGNGFPLRLNGVQFLLLWPEDIHVPGIGASPRPVHKIVIKIKL